MVSKNSDRNYVTKETLDNVAGFIHMTGPKRWMEIKLYFLPLYSPRYQFLGKQLNKGFIFGQLMWACNIRFLTNCFTKSRNGHLILSFDCNQFSAVLWIFGTQKFKKTRFNHKESFKMDMIIKICGIIPEVSC